MSKARDLLDRINEGKMSDMDVALKELGMDTPLIRSEFFTSVLASNNPEKSVDFFIMKYPKFKDRKADMIKAVKNYKW